jgi:hypothetical protein
MQQIHTFNHVYDPKMLVNKSINKKRKIKGQNINCPHIDVLKLEDGIHVYELHLKKRDTLHSITKHIIKRLLEEKIVKTWEFGERCFRFRRLLTSERLRIYEDLDATIIYNREKYRSSTSSSNYSFEDNANFDDV